MKAAPYVQEGASVDESEPIAQDGHAGGRNAERVVDQTSADDVLHEDELVGALHDPTARRQMALRYDGSAVRADLS